MTGHVDLWLENNGPKRARKHLRRWLAKNDWYVSYEPLSLLAPHSVNERRWRRLLVILTALYGIPEVYKMYKEKKCMRIGSIDGMSS